MHQEFDVCSPTGSMMSGQKAGVGITFTQLSKGGFCVVKITRGGPSDGKGVLPGDVLQLVDRTEVCFHVLPSLLLFLASNGFCNQFFDTAPGVMSTRLSSCHLNS